MNAYEKAISSLADAIDVSWYEVSCWDFKDKRPAGATDQLSKGDVVHLRNVTLADYHNDRPGLNPQELLSYSCLAITKAYFHQVEGLLSCIFYKSLQYCGVDCSSGKMMGLGIWQSEQAAYAFFTSPAGSPAEWYWRSLGAQVALGLYEVVLVTADRPASIDRILWPEIQSHQDQNII